MIHGDMVENVSGCFFWTQCISIERSYYIGLNCIIITILSQ